MTVSADSAKDQVQAATTGLVDLRGSGRRAGGSLSYDGAERVVTGWHFHDVHEIEYARSGTVEVATEAGQYLLPPHQAAWIPAGLPHQTVLPAGARTLAVIFDPDLVPAAGGQVRIIAVPDLLREMMLYTRRWPAGQPEPDEAADAFLRALAGVVGEALDRELPLHLPACADPVAAAAADYTRAHLDQVTAADVTRAVGVSERTLRRLFQAELGMSWRSYLLRARALRAIGLLAQPELSVLEVSIAVGFDDPGAFARSFARHCGETPSAYRRRIGP